ncbi:MAG TPA: efflux RND transporter periplasmic adaptor subunit [Casimicrobiaceae bacterium]
MKIAVVPKARWIKPAVAVLLALAALSLAARNLIFGTPVETYQATRGDLVQTVVASGRVITPRRVSVGSVITERVARVPVEEGQSVRRGDVLIELEDQDERAAVAQAQAAVAQAEAKVRQLREVGLPAAEQGLAQAKANATQARQAYERTKGLEAKGFISPSALDDARRNLDVAESQLEAAQLQVQTNSPRGSDYALALSALEQARASLKAARVRLDQTMVRATVDGVLIGRDVEAGNVVQPGKELMVLAPAGETEIDLLIDEKNLSRLALGQKALGSADAYPGKRFAAELFYINPGVDAVRGAVEVKLKVPDPPAYLRQDMTVSVDIEVARAANTVIVPTDAVHDVTSAQPWVLAIKGRTAVRQPIKVGLRGDTRLEVLAGVGPGDRLVPASNPAIKEGQRVRAVRA